MAAATAVQLSSLSITVRSASLSLSLSLSLSNSAAASNGSGDGLTSRLLLWECGPPALPFASRQKEGVDLSKRCGVKHSVLQYCLIDRD